MAAQPLQALPRGAAGGGGGGFFGFLKDGVVMVTRNRSLFLPLAALHAARSTAHLAAKTLAFRSFAAAVDLEAYDDGGGAVDGAQFIGLVFKYLAGRWRLLLPAGAAYLAAHATLGLAIDAAIAAAAASSSRSGEGQDTTLASVLGKVKGNLVGPMATAAFGRIVEWGLVGVGLLLAIPAAVYMDTAIALLALLFQIVAFLFALLYSGAVCEVAVVVAAAEPGLRGAGAAGRARRLMRGGRKLAQAALYSLVSWALKKAIWKVHAAAVARLPDSGLLSTTALFPVHGVVVYLLLGALKVLRTATVTAYYLDCRRTEEEDKAGHRD
ncbi:unnamed protein product [Urochloa decumbens]|uniref:Uncharacterized protein n=1 Tax=Urochloa decumbens TaxID=240449 RepID=A0ABC8ZE64_9POAL